MTGSNSGWLVAVLLFAVAGSAAGQEGPVAFEFSFSNPGARSMGLGGAFAALADDATAAFANPAGLVQLIEPELSVEGRSWSYDTPFVSGGRASGEPTGNGIDTSSFLRRGVSSTDTTDLSFASFVYPANRWSLALYRHTWADFSLSRQVDGIFATVDGEDERSEDVRATTSVEVINTGLAAAFEITKRFSIGIGIVHFESKIDSLSNEFAQEAEAFFQPSPFSPEILDTTTTLRGSTSGTIFHAGLLFRASPQWSIGGFFREGPSTTLRVLEVVGPANDESPEGTIDLDATTSLGLPDVYGLGAAYRSKGGAWTVSLEWNRVGYGSITRSLDTNVFDPGQIQLADGDEFHLGVEYVLLRTKPIVALRFGAWHDPAHTVGSGPDADVFERAIFPNGEDDTHLAAGLGLVFRNVQVDLGIDSSDTTDVVSLSFVYRF